MLLASAQTIGELVRTLHKPEFAPYFTAAEREAFLRALLDRIEIVDPAEHVSVCRDPRDDMFLELVIAGRARWLFTGDDDLLALGSFRGAAIVTPASFLEALERGVQ